MSIGDAVKRVIQVQQYLPDQALKCYIWYWHDQHDNEGRVIILEFNDYFLVNVYTPNSQEDWKDLIIEF